MSQPSSESAQNTFNISNSSVGNIAGSGSIHYNPSSVEPPAVEVCDQPKKVILFLAANPLSTHRLRLDEEIREIEAGLQRSKYRDRFELQQRWAMRPIDLRRALLDYTPQIVHFAGHGIGRTRAAQSIEAAREISFANHAKIYDEGLVLEDTTGQPKLVHTLVRAILTSSDLRRADLTGACIKDWSFNGQTCLTGVKCDYVYREFENEQPTDRYPSDRNFKPGEFEPLYQKVINSVELIFQDQVDWRALSFAFEKFQIEDDGMGLELKGVEQRGDYWIVKVAHGEGVSKQQVERQVQSTYEDLRALMEVKDRQINQLLGIVDNQTRAMNQQAEALTHFSQHPFGNSFFISGSTITNLAGSGQIEYQEAASIIRQLIAPIDDQASTLRRLIAQLSDQNIATTDEARKDLIQQVLLSEAERDPQFKQMLLQQGEQIIQSLPRKDIAIAFQAAIAQLKD